jgi:phage replication-related protein YjqB (UPF0714/DUF867 family)
MRAYAASIKYALTSQSDLLTRAEHCSADPDSLAKIGRVAGQQVRVVRSVTDFTLFTVSEARRESPETIVRMGPLGFARLGATAELSATIDGQVTHPVYTDAEAAAAGELVERLSDNGLATNLIACAPHGGMIEQFTDQQAERVASQLASKAVSSWRCKGWKTGGGAYARWHITSSDINDASFPLLGSVIRRGWRYSVAFHGFGSPNVLIGGAAPLALKQEIQSAIRGAVAASGISVDIASPGSAYDGDDPRNFVNRLSPNGIQIEQSIAARSGYWQAIADAVAAVLRPKIA